MTLKFLRLKFILAAAEFQMSPPFIAREAIVRLLSAY
jgi:hypothetical protein